MSTTTSGTAAASGFHLVGPCPLSLSVDALAAMLNFELAEHDVYDGGELQWFDDEDHGTGMLAFLSRRGDRRVDYYVQRGLNLDRVGYQIGGGTGSWTEVDFDVARLEPSDDGVDAEARFTDVDGRLIEIRVDDRDGRPRRRGGLLAPVSAGINRPNSLLLVWMPGFDLVRVTGTPPAIRIDGRDVTTAVCPAPASTVATSSSTPPRSSRSSSTAPTTAPWPRSPPAGVLWSPRSPIGSPLSTPSGPVTAPG